MAEHLEAGPGWMISGSDLRPRITDLQQFRAGVADDPLGIVLESLWSGDAAQALELLRVEKQTIRVRALTADSLRDLGSMGHAQEIYDVLVSETCGTAYEATMRQHRGKVRLALADYAGAKADFQCSVQLRRDGDPSLLASAQQALEVAEEQEAHAAQSPVN